MGRINIPDDKRVTDVRGHIEEIAARQREEAAERAEMEKQAKEAARAVQPEGMHASASQAGEDGGSSGTDVLDLTDPEGYFARLQRRQENEARKAGPAAGEKTQPGMAGKAMAAKGRQDKAPAMAGEPAGKGTTEKEAPEEPSAREAETGQEARAGKRAPGGPMDAVQGKTEKAVKLRTDPKERAKDLTNASKEDTGQRVSGAAAKAHIAREKAMTTAQILFYSAQEQSRQAEGERMGSPAPKDEKAGPRREGRLHQAAGKEPPADQARQPGITGRENARDKKQPARKGKVPSTAAPALENKPGPMDGKAVPRPDMGQTAAAGMEAPAAKDAGEGLRSPAAKAMPLPAQDRTSPVSGRTAPAAGREQPGKTNRGHPLAVKAGEGKSLTANAAKAMEGKSPASAAEKQPRPARSPRSHGRAPGKASGDRIQASRPGVEQAGNTGKAGVPGMEQPARAVKDPISVSAGKQEGRSVTGAKASGPEMGVTSQGKVFERFDLDKTLSNAYDTSKAYRTVMEMAAFTHTNGRPVSVTHEGETLRFDKDQEGNTFASINGTRVEPLEAARFLVRYDRATMGGAAVLTARLQLALRDPFQKGDSVPAKAPVPGKEKETGKGEGRKGKAEKGKAEKASRAGKEITAGR